MGCNPNVELIEPNFKRLLYIAHGLPILGGVLDIDANPNEAVLI